MYTRKQKSPVNRTVLSFPKNPGLCHHYHHEESKNKDFHQSQSFPRALLWPTPSPSLSLSHYWLGFLPCGLAFPQKSHKWNHAVCRLLSLAVCHLTYWCVSLVVSYQLLVSMSGTLCFLAQRDEMIGSSSPWLWRNQILHLGPLNNTEAWECGGQTSLPGTKGSPGMLDCQWDNQASPGQPRMVGWPLPWEKLPLRSLSGSSRQVAPAELPADAPFSVPSPAQGGLALPAGAEPLLRA